MLLRLATVIFTLGLVSLVHSYLSKSKNENCNLIDADLKPFKLTHVRSQLLELEANSDHKLGFGNPNEKIMFNFKGISVHTLHDWRRSPNKAANAIQTSKTTILATNILEYI